MKLSDFDYNLPQELIAQYPLKERDSSRMMVLERASREIRERRFKDLPEFINKGDTIVLNNARVINARLLGKKDTGAKIELFLLEKIEEDTYKVLAKPSKRLKPGSKVFFKNNISAEIMDNADFGKIVKFFNNSKGDLEKKLHEIGQIPLPPYIKRAPEKLDEKNYQTVYAKTDGSTASPTAGLHFTDVVLGQLKSKGVNIAEVTLDVSYGTFAPVLEENIEEHKMHKEYFKLPKQSAEIINETKARGNKILAVGTTATRVLETCAVGNKVIPKGGYTDLFIYPGYKFKIVDRLLTNFHLPKSTLLMLISAFAGREFILDAYQNAINSKFRFFSYGDCMLII